MIASQGQPQFPGNRTLGSIKNAGKSWRPGGPWTRKPDEVEKSEGKLYQPSDGHRHRLGDFSIWRNASHGQTISQSWQLICLLNMYGIEWEKYQVKHLPSQAISKSEGMNCHHQPQRYCKWACGSIHGQLLRRPLQCYIPDHKGARGKGGNWLHLRQHWSVQQTFLIEGPEAVNHEGQTPCTCAWWDPQQFVETSPWGHTEVPKRDTEQDMDLCGFSWPVQSSNCDPDPQTKQGPHWPTQL